MMVIGEQYKKERRETWLVYRRRNCIILGHALHENGALLAPEKFLALNLVDRGCHVICIFGMTIGVLMDGG
jgi:hypothetical protein